MTRVMLLGTVLTLVAATADAKLVVVATTPDLAAIARAVGGARVRGRGNCASDGGSALRRRETELRQAPQPGGCPDRGRRQPRDVSP